MSQWSLIREVAWREIVTRSRTTAFRLITGLLVAAAIVLPIVVAVLPDDGDELRTVTVGLVGVDQATQDQITAFAAGSLDVEFADLSASSPDDVELELVEGRIDVAIEPGPTLVWNRETDFEIASVVFTALQQQEVLVRGRSVGLDPSEVAGLLSPVELEERFADEADEADEVATGVALLGLMVAFILPQAYGQLTMLSVVEEKSTRVIEVLLNHLRPHTLLIGKVLGVGALAVVQLVVVVAGLTGALLLTRSISIPPSVWQFVPILLVSILGGLAIYNTFFALLGSLVSRQEDASQVVLPVFLPIIIGYLVGQAAVFGNAETPLVKFLSYFPLTSPMLLPVRVARDVIAPWEIALSLALLALGVWVLIRIAGRVYEFTLLHTGSKVSWSQLIRLSRGVAFD